MPASSAYRTRFGSLLRAYQLAGYRPDRDYRYPGDQPRARPSPSPAPSTTCSGNLCGVGAHVTRDAGDGPAVDQRRVHGVDGAFPLPTDGRGPAAVAGTDRPDARARHHHPGPHGRGTTSSRPTTTCCRSWTSRRPSCSYAKPTASTWTPTSSTLWTTSPLMAKRKKD